MFDNPHITLGTAALVIFVLCAAFILMRGVTRMILTALILAGSLWVGFLVWQRAPSLAISWTGQPAAWLVAGLPVLAFVVTFLAARLVIGFFLRPFRRSGASRSPLAILSGFLLSIASTGILWLTGATLLHHIGSIAEIGKASDRTSPSPMADLTVRLKQSIASIVPEFILEHLDPLADPNHIALAKLIANQSRPDPEPVIDPETGKPYPRAIIVNEPDLQDLATERRFSTLLHHPRFQQALRDPKIRKILQDRRISP